MSECDLCKTKESTCWMCQGEYTTCSKCSKDIQAFDVQPMKNQNLKMLLEVFIRRGRGEEITFEEVFKEKSNFKFIDFKEIWRMDK